MTGENRPLVERIYAQYRGRLRSFLYGRVRRDSVAAELAQEVYLRLLRVRDLNEIHNLEAYLFTVARNLATEYQIKESATRNAMDIDDPAVQDQIIDPPNLAEQLDDERHLARMWKVLTELPRKCQDTVVLRLRYGLSYEEIGQKLDISTNMVKKYLSQALAHCRRRMAGHGASP
jgi:RNA polymerase sigma-70 factor (ECF subfamily)